MSYKLFIGIDPAFRDKGFAMAIINNESKEVSFKMFRNGFLDFCKWLDNEPPEIKDTIFCVENSNLQKSTFDMRGSKNVIARKSRNVGKNQAASQYTVDILKAKGYEVLDISPKDKGGKWTAEGFKWVVKSKKLILTKARPNQDERDALKLAIMAINRSKFVK
jgi:hypothetical protein